MPLINNPHGFRPLMRNIMGGPVEIQEMNKLVGVATAIFRNDVVSIATGGNIQPGRSTTIVGVSLDPGAASKATAHKVIISPFSMYEAQDDDAVTGLLAADMGKNANASVAVAGNAATQISGHQISKSSVATTNTLDLQLHRLHDEATNSFGTWCRCEVSFNVSYFNLGRTGV